jgi:hypothetical protein
MIGAFLVLVFGASLASWILVSWFFPSVPVFAFVQTFKKLPGFSPYLGVMKLILHFVHKITAVFRQLKYYRQHLLSTLEEKHIATKTAVGFGLLLAAEITGQFGNGPGVSGADYITH